ncbi:MAG: zinc ribbon domain-containing protein [Acetatifactor sp.]|nr:zinc ribbon domain-containing protein [Acetatifactor sp.]
MARMIRCKGCGAEIDKSAKTCPQCGRKNKKHTWLIVLGVIVVLAIISSISGKIKENKAKKVTYKWPDTGIAILLPDPKAKYGEIDYDSQDYFSIKLYDIRPEHFSSYVEKCKEKGFTVDYNGGSSYYYAMDGEGNDLSIFYDDDEKEMNIQITHLTKYNDVAEEDVSEVYDDEFEDEYVEEENLADDVDEINDRASEAETLAEAESEEVTKASAESSKSDQKNDDEFREWVDEYEEFMNKYIDFMISYDASDLTSLAKYSELMLEYAEYLDETSDLSEEDFSYDDWAYYMDAEVRILNKMSKIQ